MSWTYRPTANAARAGTQIGHVVYADEKRVPRAASASRFGVAMNGCSAAPRNLGLCSSDMSTRRLAGFTMTSIARPSRARYAWREEDHDAPNRRLHVARSEPRRRCPDLP